jgi:DNA-binding transcriptional LysR family regulator
MLDWHDFQLFLAIARAGTLSGAARQLRVDQSTASRRLVALERAAGSRLFDRTPSGYRLTRAGEAVLPNAEEIERQALEAERRLAGQDERPEGHVRLATSDSFAAWFVIPQLAGFARAYPGVSVSIVTANRQVSLARREADLALRPIKPTEPNLIAKRLAASPWALYGAKTYLERRTAPRLRDQLAGHDVIAFDPELKGTAGARFLARHAGRAQVVLATSSLVTQAAAVSAGLGLCPLPCLFGDREPTLRRALPGSIGSHDLWLVVHPDLRTSARVRALMDYLSATIERESAWISGRVSARRRPRPA